MVLGSIFAILELEIKRTTYYLKELEGLSYLQ